MSQKEMEDTIINIQNITLNIMQNLQEIKKEQQEIKNEQQEMKKEQQEMKKEQQEMKKEIKEIKAKQDEMQEELTKIGNKVTVMEYQHGEKIQLILDTLVGHIEKFENHEERFRKNEKIIELQGHQIYGLEEKTKNNIKSLPHKNK